METEKQLLAEQLEREKAMTYIAPIEGEALLLLRKKEIRKIEEMRRDQENTMQQLIATHYSDMEAQQRQAIIDMEELAQLINFDNVAVTEQERAEAMQAEDVDVRTYGMEQINEILNDQRTEAQLEEDRANAVAPTPEVGDYGYTELGQDAEEVVFDFIPEAEPEETPAEETVAEETAAPVEEETQAEDTGAPTDEWSFIDTLEASDETAATPAVDLSTPEDRENKPTTFKERWANWKKKRAEEKARKAEEKRRREEEKKAQKERLKKLEEENKAAAASFAPTTKKSTNPYTPTAQEILAPQQPTPTPTANAPHPDITINSSGGTNAGGARPRTFIPRSYTPISVTPDNVHDLIGDKKKKK